MLSMVRSMPRRGESAALEALKRLHVDPAPPARAARTQAGEVRARTGTAVDPRRVRGSAAPAPFAPARPPSALRPPAAWGDGPAGRPEQAVADEAQERGPGGRRRGDEGVEANARLTGMTAAVLLVLFAAEGLTILRIRSLLTPHVFIGMLLIPPVLVKIGSTSWRFSRYYLGAPAYRRKGPPPPLLRLLGPVIVLLTLAVLATGVALLLAPAADRNELLFLHKASFVLWFVVTAVHVLGHILETARLAPADFVERTRRQVRGAGARQWLVASSLVVGLFLALAVVPRVGPWLTAGLPVHHR
jgi:hypothetical protein